MTIIEQNVQLEHELNRVEYLKRIEKAGRTCYKSENLITEESAKKFVSNIVKLGHESVIEHLNVSFRIITDRGVSLELVRHRIASYSQESSRYCLSGDTIIHTKNLHKKITIKELYDKQINDKTQNWKRLLIKQINEKTGEIIYNTPIKIFKNGIKDVYEIKTRLGYSLKCTKDHKIYTQYGFKKLEEINVNDKIYTDNTDNIALDDVVSIEKCGATEVYDIEMPEPNHNYVANGIVVHNCSYNKDKFGNELTFIKPILDKKHNINETYYMQKWENAMQQIEDTYLDMANNGVIPEYSRQVLPNSLKTEIVATMNLRAWRNFLKLRMDKSAHPQIRDIAFKIFDVLNEKLPEIFQDLEKLKYE